MREDLTGQKLVCRGLLGTLPHIYASITRRVGKTILYLFSCFILLISDLESLGELCTYTRNHILYAFQCWYYQMIKGQEKFLLISPIPIPQFWMHACTIVTYRWKRELSFGLDSINRRFQDPDIAKIKVKSPFLKDKFQDCERALQCPKWVRFATPNSLIKKWADNYLIALTLPFTWHPVFIRQLNEDGVAIWPHRKSGGTQSLHETFHWGQCWCDHGASGQCLFNLPKICLP